jgi:hypothetical protein
MPHFVERRCVQVDDGGEAAKAACVVRCSERGKV